MLWCDDRDGETVAAQPDAVTKVTNESLLINDIDRVKSLQAALFPVYNKGTYLASFLSNAIKSNQLEINTDNKTFRTIAKLKEPRELFALPKELDCPQQAARWPTECQVLDERVHHIEYCPPVPEAYYTPTGRELKPQPVGEEAGTVTFQYYPMSAVNYVRVQFSRSTVGGSRLFLSACSTGGDSDELHFESRFECGNLAKAVRITATYYELHLRTDLYTNRHMQWFYFRVSSTRKHVMYRFSIVNLTKPESLYNEGMMPLLYSTRDAQLHSIGWRRCGKNICYFKNDPTCEEEEQFPCYTLTFNIEFPHDGDEVYLAHCYPYSYTDLQDYLAKLQNHPIKSTFTKIRLLCRTLAGNNVYYLTITAPSSENEIRKKRAIVITARVHPGETPSSWMMKGFLDFLTGDSSQARELREKFIFKLIPMLNPDGVIVGNNRCSLTGKDLNRQYRTVIRETYPSVWHTKLMIRRLMEECGVVMYCDLHAHSRKHNVFIYGCENRRGADKRLHEQVFPLMLHKNSADKFSFENCKFRIQRSKEGTGRVVIWMMGVANSYTMEASFGGSELGGRTSTHFSPQDFESLGRTFCETLLDFYDEEPSKERLRNKIITRLLKEGSSADEPTNIKLSDYSSDEGDTSCSSSEGEGGRGFSSCGAPRDENERPLAPPPSPVLPAAMRQLRASKLSRRCQPKPERIKCMPVTQRETLAICRATIDLASDAITDISSGSETEDEESPVRMVKKLFKPQVSVKPRRRKKMPPELKVWPAPVYESPENSDKERLLKPIQRPRSVSFNEMNDSNHMKMMTWHQFRCFPPPKYLSEMRNNRQGQPAELEVKLTTLKRGVWLGVDGDGPNQGPLSWGVSSFAMNSYFTDSEALLRSCSKKLEALEGQNNKKEEKHKKKKKSKSKATVKSSHLEDGSEGLENKIAKPWTKKNKLKLGKIKDSPIYTHSSSFTEVPQPNAPQVMTRITNDQTKTKAKTRFRKSGYVATAIQTKKTKANNQIQYTDNSDTDNSCDYKLKTKRTTNIGRDRRQSQTKISGSKAKT